MDFIVDTGQPAAVVVGASGVEEILQNVRTILTTIRGTVPLDRTFGVPITFLDRPLPEAMAEYTGAAIDEIETREPRCTVVRVDFQPRQAEAMDGRLYPVVRIAIRGEA